MSLAKRLSLTTKCLRDEFVQVIKKYALSILFFAGAVISPASYSNASLPTPFAPYSEHYALFYLMQDALPHIHYSKKLIDGDIGVSMAIELSNQLNDYGVVFDRKDFEELRSKGEFVANAVNSL